MLKTPQGAILNHIFLGPGIKVLSLKNKGNDPMHFSETNIIPAYNLFIILRVLKDEFVNIII